MAARERPDRVNAPSFPAAAWPALDPEDAALVADLVRRGVSVVGPDFGKPLDEDDEILKPGPPCPGAVDALLEDRRQGP